MFIFLSVGAVNSLINASGAWKQAATHVSLFIFFNNASDDYQILFLIKIQINRPPVQIHFIEGKKFHSLLFKTNHLYRCKSHLSMFDHKTLDP